MPDLHFISLSAFETFAVVTIVLQWAAILVLFVVLAVVSHRLGGAEKACRDLRENHDWMEQRFARFERGEGKL